MKTKKLLSCMLALVMVFSMMATLGITASAKEESNTCAFDSTEKKMTVQINVPTKLTIGSTPEPIALTVDSSFCECTANYMKRGTAYYEGYDTELYMAYDNFLWSLEEGTVAADTTYAYCISGEMKNSTDFATVEATVNGQPVEVIAVDDYYFYFFVTIGTTDTNGNIVANAVLANDFLDLETSTDLNEKKELDQNYNLTVTEVPSASGAVTKVKLSWEINDINAVRMDNKVWDTDELKWIVDSSNTNIMNNGTAKFTLENYSSVKVRATASFAAETGFDPTVTYTGKNGRITLDTANGNDTYSKTNVPTGTINVTVKPGDDDFKTLAATTSAAKYGTYTVTLSEDVSDYQSYANGIATATAPATFVVDEANKTITIKDEIAFLYYGLVYNAANADRMTAKLDADLDLDELIIANGFKNNCNFDGQNHTVANVTINGAANGAAGFFKAVSTNVKNLVLDNITVNGGVSTTGGYFGILAGEANANTIENVTVKNSSVSNGKFTGGLVGFAYVHNIKNCSVIDSAISCQYKCGGMIGYTCMECVNPADNYVNITDNTVKNVIINCANLLEGKNHYETGKVVGDWNAETGTYTDNTVTNVTIVNGSEGYTENEIGAIESGCTVSGYGN